MKDYFNIFRLITFLTLLIPFNSFSQIYNSSNSGHAGHDHSGHNHSGHNHGKAEGAGGENTPEAQDFWKDAKGVQVSNKCPGYLIQKVKEDSKIGVRNWFGKKVGSSDDYCGNSLSKLVDTPNATELSKRLASHPMTSFGDKNEGISENCLNSVQEPERKKLLVAEYYSNSARLKMAAMSSLENIAAIDSVLGKSTLKNVDCAQGGMTSLSENCEKLKSCQSRGGLEEQAKELQAIYPQYIALKKEVSELNSANSVTGASMGYVPNPAQISAMRERGDKSSEKKKKIQALEAMYPVLNGKAFKETFDPNKQNFQEALQNQLEKSRDKISEQFKDYQKGIGCLSGNGGSCEKFDETLKSAPPLNIHAFKRGQGLSFEDGQVQAYLGAVECRQKIREVHENQNQALKDLAVGVGLTVATAGLGSLAATGRLAFLSAEQAQAASVAVKTGSQFSSRAKMASNALLGIDLVSLGEGGKDAYEQCSKSLNQLTSAQSKNDSSLTDASCPANSGSAALPQLSADYRSCVAQVLLQGVTNVLPLVPGAVAGAKSALGSAERGAVSAEKSLAREGAVLEKEASSEVRGLASSHRDAEARVLDMSPEKKLQIAENMNLSDVDRSAKIAKEMGLASSDPRVQDLMKLHSDPRFSKTLEGSTDELQKKITAGMEVMYPGYQNMDGPARNALASERVKMKGLVANGVLGEASSNVSITNAFRKVQDEKLMGLLTPKDKDILSSTTYNRGEKIKETIELNRFFDVKSSAESRSGSARMIAEKLRDTNPETSLAFYRQSLEEHNFAAQQKYGRPLSEDSKYFESSRTAAHYVDVAAHAGDQKAVNMGIKKEVEEFFDGQSKHMGWAKVTDAALYELELAGRQQEHARGLKRTISEEAWIRKQKALIDAYPEIQVQIGQQRVSKINADFANLKTPEVPVSQVKTVIPSVADQAGNAAGSSNKIKLASSELNKALNGEGDLLPKEVAQRALNDLKENSELASILNQKGDAAEELRPLRNIASYAGDLDLVRKTTSAYIRRGVNGLSYSDSMAFFAENLLQRDQAIIRGYVVGEKVEAAKLRLKILLEEYPPLQKYSTTNVAVAAESNVTKASTPAPVSNPAPAVSAPAPKATVATQTQNAAPSVTAPSKTPEVSAPQTALTPPKPKPPANASSETISHLERMSKETGLESKLIYARFASDNSRNNGGGASVDVAQYALGRLKEVDPEFIKKPHIRDNLKHVESVVEIASQAKDDELLKEAMRLKMLAEAKEHYKRMPNDLEFQGWGGEYLLGLEKKTRDPSVFKDPARLDRVRRQQRVLYQLCEDNMALRDPNKSLRGYIEEYFKTQK